MMKREGGFITPLALAIIIIVSSYVSFQLITLKSEQQFYLQTEQAIIIETLMQRGTVHVINEIETHAQDNFEGAFNYVDGKITYNVTYQDEAIYIVSMNVQTNNGHLNRMVSFIYDKQQGVLSEWQEAKDESNISYWVYGSRQDNGGQRIESCLRFTNA